MKTKYNLEELQKEIFPNILGNNKIKEAILMQYLSDNQFNILLIGDPGSAKSMFIKAIKSLLLNEIKDEKKTGPVNIIETQNFLLIDDFGKLSCEENWVYMNSTKKIFATANPRYGRFDPYGNLGSQLGLSPTVLAKFDLIFIVRDIPDKKRDAMIVEQAFMNFIGSEEIIQVSSKVRSYMKELKEEKIKLDKSIMEIAKKFYVELRNYSMEEDDEFYSIPITARSLETIFKLTSGYTKINHNIEAKKKEIESAIDLYSYCLEKIGIDPKTGRLDADRVALGITESERKAFSNIKNILEEIEAEEPEIKLTEVFLHAEDLNYNPQLVLHILDNLKQQGIIFEPKKNVYRFVRQ